MSHDQRPARLKVVGAKTGQSRAGGQRRNDGASAAPVPIASTDRVELSAKAPREHLLALSILFIVGSLVGGVAMALAPMLGGQ